MSMWDVDKGVSRRDQSTKGSNEARTPGGDSNSIFFKRLLWFRWVDPRIRGDEAPARTRRSSNATVALVTLMPVIGAHQMASRLRGDGYSLLDDLEFLAWFMTQENRLGYGRIYAPLGNFWVIDGREHFLAIAWHNGWRLHLMDAAITLDPEFVYPVLIDLSG